MGIPLAVLAVTGLVWLLRRHGHGDGDSDNGDRAAWITSAAASWLPAHRRDWGRAMAAELAQVHGRASRWRFTAGVLRVVLFPPSRHHGRAGIVAVAGLVATAAATVAAVREVPTMSVFAAVLGLLLCGYATMVMSRSHGLRPTAPRVIVGAVALAGVAAAIVTVARIAVAYPAATADPTHVVSVLFALALAGCLALALGPFWLGNRPDTALWWALGGALAGGAAEIAIILAGPATAGPSPFVSPTVAAATLAASAGAAATSCSRPTGAQAGLLAAVLGVLANFTVTLTTILHLKHYTLAGAADAAAYAHSGYPSVASYVLSDTLSGGIIAGLVLGPVVLLGVAVLGAGAGTGLRELAARRAAA
jgi:hypothetical protein